MIIIKNLFYFMLSTRFKYYFYLFGFKTPSFLRKVFLIYFFSCFVLHIISFLDLEFFFSCNCSPAFDRESTAKAVEIFSAGIVRWESVMEAYGDEPNNLDDFADALQGPVQEVQDGSRQINELPPEERAVAVQQVEINVRKLTNSTLEELHQRADQSLQEVSRQSEVRAIDRSLDSLAARVESINAKPKWTKADKTELELCNKEII